MSVNVDLFHADSPVSRVQKFPGANVSANTSVFSSMIQLAPMNHRRKRKLRTEKYNSVTCAHGQLSEVSYQEQRGTRYQRTMEYISVPVSNRHRADKREAPVALVK